VPLERKYTVEEYLAFLDEGEERLEFDDGTIYAMAGETGEHNDIVSNIVIALTQETRNKGCRLRQQNVKLYINAHKYYFPDVMVLCGPRPSDPRTESDPCFIVEVLSPSTANRDKGVKFNAYLKLSSLEKYVLIEPAEKLVGVYSRSTQGWLYESLEEGAVDIPCIKARLSLEQIYQGIPLQS